MSLIRIYAVFLRNIFLLQRNWTRFSNIFVWIAVDIVLWGFITKYLDSVSRSGFSFVPVLLGAVLLWDFLVRIKHGVVLALLEDTWSRNFINYFASPLKIGEYIVGLVLTSVVTGAVGFAMIFLLAVFAFGLDVLKFGGAFILFLAILFLFGLALGIATAAIMFRFGPAAEWIAWPIAALISPFAGVFYPISTLPLVIQPIAKIIPASYVFEGMRAVLSSGAIPLFQILTGIGLSLAYLFLAYLLFLYMYRVVIKNGAIVRFSAEDVS